jgi:hypothetical protein
MQPSLASTESPCHTQRESIAAGPFFHSHLITQTESPRPFFHSHIITQTESPSIICCFINGESYRRRATGAGPAHRVPSFFLVLAQFEFESLGAVQRRGEGRRWWQSRGWGGRRDAAVGARYVAGWQIIADGGGGALS